MVSAEAVAKRVAGGITLKEMTARDTALTQKSTYWDDSGIRSLQITPILENRPRKIIENVSHVYDRFIPPRTLQNYESSKYNLTTLKPLSEREVDENFEIPILEKVKDLYPKYRRKKVTELLREKRVMRDLDDNRVLRLTERKSSGTKKLPGNMASRPEQLRNETVLDDGLWTVRPRKRPLLGLQDSVFRLDGLQPTGNRNVVDWSAKNMIATIFEDHVFYCDFNDMTINCNNQFHPLNEISLKATSIKFNNEGDKLAVGTTSDAGICVVDMETRKILWKKRCRCELSCEVNCIRWAKKDSFLITSCSTVIVLYTSHNGSIIDVVRTHNSCENICLELSCNDIFFAVSGTDSYVHIYTFFDFQTLLSVKQDVPATSLAWHPKHESTLCVGGGIGDASLLLFDVNSPESITLRRMNFYGMCKSLAWNKISCELVVNWTRLSTGHRCSILPVMASLDCVVDEAMSYSDDIVNSLLWSPNHTILGAIMNEHLLSWNFFGKNSQQILPGKMNKKMKPKTENQIIDENCGHYFPRYLIR